MIQIIYLWSVEIVVKQCAAYPPHRSSYHWFATKSGIDHIYKR